LLRPKVMLMQNTDLVRFTTDTILRAAKLRSRYSVECRSGHYISTFKCTRYLRERGGLSMVLPTA